MGRAIVFIIIIFTAYCISLIFFTYDIGSDATMEFVIKNMEYQSKINVSLSNNIHQISNDIDLLRLETRYSLKELHKGLYEKR